MELRKFRGVHNCIKEVKQSSGCGALRHFFDGPRTPGLEPRSEKCMGRQAGETEWTGTTNQAKPYSLVVAIAQRSLKHLYNAQVKALGNE